jgi:hypothetical protein
MRDDHWLDQLNRVVALNTPRREVVRAAGALITAQLLGWQPAAEAGAAPERCGHSLCRKNFTKKKDRDFCEIKCGRCRIRDKFCIVRDAKNKRATCCHEDQQCCQDTKLCCSLDAVCCPPSSNRVGCCAAGRACCPSDFATGCCEQHQTCCLEGGCVDTSLDRLNCGGCGIECPRDQICVDGSCLCPPGTKKCVFGGPPTSVPIEACVPERWACCGYFTCNPGESGPLLECCGNSCVREGQCPL